MISDNVLIAIITAVPIITTQIITYLLQKNRVEKVHEIVNNNQTALITKNEVLQAENKQLRQDKIDIINVASKGPVDIPIK